MPSNRTCDLPCEKILNSGQRLIEVKGPIPQKEAAAVHQDFWKKD